MFEPQPGSWITVEPAYGRDYKNKAEALADWDGGKDFRETSSGRYTDKAYCESKDYKVIIRYGKGMKNLDTTAKRR